MTATAAFWKESGARFRATMSADASKGATRAALKTRVAWVSASFLLLYVGMSESFQTVQNRANSTAGIEVSLGGWLVNFMIEVRNGEEFASGLVATG